MVKSPNSCLKIIACGSDSANESDSIDAPETRASGDKKKWSFRKRSGRHRVIGNNVNSETTNVTNKDIPQGINTEFQGTAMSNTPDEKAQLSTKPVEKITEVVFSTEHASKLERALQSQSDGRAKHAEFKMSKAEVAVENDSIPASPETKTSSPAVGLENNSNADVAELVIGYSAAVSEGDSADPSESKMCDTEVAAPNCGNTGAIMDQPMAIIIQTAIRGFLAQRAYLQLKSAIKLQAAIRGHLVRRDAVESLHCIQAIIKVQAHVRAHRAKSLDHNSKLSDAQFAAAKLLKNGFARQLLESSSPESKSMNIRCDPLRPNSFWGWLERWMSVLASNVDQKSVPISEPKDDIPVREITVPNNAQFESNIVSDSVTSNLNMTEVVNSEENDENYMKNGVTTTDFSPHDPLSKEVKMEQPHPDTTDVIEDDAASTMMDEFASKKSSKQADARSFVNKSDLESEQSKLSTERLPPKELDSERNKFVYGSKKASNPAFVAAQSKFKELSSVASSDTLVSPSYHDLGSDIRSNTSSAIEVTVKKSNDPTVVETAPFVPRSHVAGSECGTELSISSTLDSPDRSDIGNAEAERSTFLQETSCDPNSGEVPKDEPKVLSGDYVADSPSVRIQQEEAHRINGRSVDPVDAKGSPQEEQKPEAVASNIQSNSDLALAKNSSQMEQKYESNGLNTVLEHDSGTEHKGCNLSPEASPKTHRTVPESQGTPSSQVSVKSKKSKAVNNASRPKRSPLSVGKRSPSNSGLDSGARSSTENLLKDHKSEKRRNSFGSSKFDNADQEPKDSSSRNSLPSYMQATESARAKALSPKSSPDVNDKEVTSKKRDSLVGASGKQVSPRIQSSTSPAPQSAKTNGSNERKWQR